MNLLDYKSFLNEMANISFKTTGIKDVIIWCGEKPSMHGRRVKICNHPNNFDLNNTFTVTIPELKIVGTPDKRFDSKLLEKIFTFITDNMKDLNDFCDGKINKYDFAQKVIENRMKKEKLKELEKNNNEKNRKNNLFEFKDYRKQQIMLKRSTTLTYKELYDTNMSYFTEFSTGIKDTVIWMGANPYSPDIKRVKISNTSDYKNHKDLFTINLNDFNIIGDVNISNDKLEEILNFLRLNMMNIIKYSNYLSATDEFDDSLVKL